MILDVMLSGPDGFEILRQIRQESRQPVIMLTARTGRSDRVRCFELGADDYLAKPFYPEELLARVHAIVRRWAPDSCRQPDTLRRGRWEPTTISPSRSIRRNCWPGCMPSCGAGRLIPAASQTRFRQAN